MNRPLTVACLVSALAGGCSRPAPPDPPEPPRAAYDGGAIQIARWGVGPIRPGTFFEAPRVQDLFPKAVVREGEIRIAADETLAVITVAQDGAQMLEIDDGTGNWPGTDDPMIGQVRAVGGPVRGPGGETLATPWAKAHFDLTQCEIGSDHDANKVVCARPGDGQVTYVFAVPGWDSEELPPPGLLRAKAYLSQIVWTPPPPSQR
jgi:hypothetical protein